MPGNFNWLVARPIAHRGLHDAARGIVENSLAAARAAVAGHYAIECDVQLSADGEAVVFHDDTLDRLTEARGRLDARPLAELTRLTLRGSGETMPAFSRLLETVAGRAPLAVELKSRFDGDLSLARRVAELVAGYDGPLALEGFDPDPIAFLRAEGAALGVGRVPLGMVAQARYDADEWPELPEPRRAELEHWLHFSAHAAGLFVLQCRGLAARRRRAVSRGAEAAGHCLDRALRRAGASRRAVGGSDCFRGLLALTTSSRRPVERGAHNNSRSLGAQPVARKARPVGPLR